jgi:hypothetical protein
MLNTCMSPVQHVKNNAEQCSHATVCGVISDGVAAVFGPRAPATMGIVQSVCETLEVPNLQIYPEVPEYRGHCLINLQPEQESVAQVGDTTQTHTKCGPCCTTHRPFLFCRPSSTL